ADGDAKETGHVRRPSSSDRKRAGDGRGQRERLTEGREIVAAAATGTRPEAGHGKHEAGNGETGPASAVRRPPGPPTAPGGGSGPGRGRPGRAGAPGVAKAKERDAPGLVAQRGDTADDGDRGGGTIEADGRGDAASRDRGQRGDRQHREALRSHRVGKQQLA